MSTKNINSLQVLCKIFKTKGPCIYLKVVYSPFCACAKWGLHRKPVLFTSQYLRKMTDSQPSTSNPNSSSTGRQDKPSGRKDTTLEEMLLVFTYSTLLSDGKR